MRIMINRKFILGSEWIYCKIYIGELSADKLLINLLFPFMLELEREKIIDKWFFIRYIDNSFHIRIRIHLISICDIGMVIHQIHVILDPYIQNRRIHALVYDTYTRELERYGTSSYEITESIFYYDSLFILKVIQSSLHHPSDNSLKWKSAIILVDDIFDITKISIEKRKIFCENKRNYFRQEFGFSQKDTLIQFNKKYRDNKSNIEHAMNRKAIPEQMLSLLSERKALLEKMSYQLMQDTSINIENYISSIIHMTINRVFISSNRLCEMLIYDFLFRYYNSLIQRNNH